MADKYHHCEESTCGVTREQKMALKHKYRCQPRAQMGYPPHSGTSGKTPARPELTKAERDKRKLDRELTEANRRVKVLGPDMQYHWFRKDEWDKHGRALLAR